MKPALSNSSTRPWAPIKYTYYNSKNNDLLKSRIKIIKLDLKYSCINEESYIPRLALREYTL